MALGSITALAVSVGQHGRPFHDLELGTPFVAVDRNPVALPGRMRIERVAERHVPRVVHDHRQVVLCSHAWTEHILVTLVAVVGLRRPGRAP